MDVPVRDFVYMDVERLKSIVAQIDEGLAETSTITTGRTQQTGGAVKGGLPGVLMGSTNLSALWENRQAETRSLHDFLYNHVEAALLARDLLLRIPDDVADLEAPGIDASTWLPETGFFLARGRVSINDFAQMRLVLENMNKIVAFIAHATSQREDDGLTVKQRKQIEQLSIKQMQLDDKQLKGFRVFFDTFYKDRIAIKLAPFPLNTDFRLVGNLDRGLLRDDIDSITYKYGTSPVGTWTIFGQVASIPPALGTRPLPVAGGGEIEQALHALFDALREIESVAQSVVYPEVSVTPIAIYRE